MTTQHSPNHIELWSLSVTLIFIWSQVCHVKSISDSLVVFFSILPSSFSFDVENLLEIYPPNEENILKWFLDSFKKLMLKIWLRFLRKKKLFFAKKIKFAKLSPILDVHNLNFTYWYEQTYHDSCSLYCCTLFFEIS